MSAIPRALLSLLSVVLAGSMMPLSIQVLSLAMHRVAAASAPRTPLIQLLHDHLAVQGTPRMYRITFSSVDRLDLRHDVRALVWRTA